MFTKFLTFLSLMLNFPQLPPLNIRILKNIYTHGRDFSTISREEERSPRVLYLVTSGPETYVPEHSTMITIKINKTMNTSVGFQHRPGHLMIDHMTWSDVETLLNLRKVSLEPINICYKYMFIQNKVCVFDLVQFIKDIVQVKLYDLDKILDKLYDLDFTFYWLFLISSSELTELKKIL